MKTFIALLTLSISFGALANTALINTAKRNSGVQAVLLASAAEAQMRLANCTTSDVKAEGNLTDGSVSFTVSCNNHSIEYGVSPKIEGYFIDGKFFLQTITVNRAG